MRSVNARTSGAAGLPAATACRPISAASKNSARHDAIISAAAFAGIRPASASDSASAASKSSIACSHASSLIAASTSALLKSGSTNPSAIEEDGFTRALKMNVEAETAVLPHRNEGRALRRRKRLEHRVGVIRVVLIGEIQAGDEAGEQTTREHRHVEVGRTRGSVSRRLARDDGEVAFLIGGATACAFRLPGFDHRVGNGIAI